MDLSMKWFGAATVAVALASPTLIDRTASAVSARAESPTEPDMATTGREVPPVSPFSFEENAGQLDRQVEFLARGSGYRLFLTRHEAVLSLHQAEAGRRGYSSETLRLSVVGGRPASVEGLDRLAGQSHYFIGQDQAGWRPGVARFARVRYDEIYPGIDVIYYGNHGRLEYDFIVAPGVDPGQIRLRFDGARAVTVNDAGGLTVAMSSGEVLQHAPIIYQERDGERHSVEGGYTRHENGELGFDVAAYDERLPLVIDPIIVWSTYVGGNQLDVLHQMKVDAAGYIYLAGRTLSSNFPTTVGAFDTTFNVSNEDAFVTKLSPDGMSLVYSTYIGGTGTNGIFQLGDSAYSMDIDAAGSAYIAGETHSLNFPVTPGAYQTSFGGGAADGYVVKLSPDGSSLEYATYLGGAGFAIATGVAVDAAGQAHVAVRIATHTGAFPTTPGSVDMTPNGDWDAAVAKLSADGSTLLWSTYLGGSLQDHPGTIGLDASGNVYVGIRTTSANFPITAGAFQTVKAGTSSTFDVALAKISPDGGTLVYSTFLGGPGNDVEVRLLVDALARVHLTGNTAGGFPVTANALQPTFGGGASDAYLTVVSADGSSLEYSTYLGGSSGDSGTNVAFDSAGNLWWSGSTASLDFPTTAGSFPHAGGSDAFVVHLDPTLTSLLFSTFVGGSGSESAFIGLDAADGVYIAGSTTGSLPVTAGAFQSAFAGGSNDLYAMKLEGLQTNQAPEITVLVDPLVLEGNMIGGYDNGAGLSAVAAGVSATDPDADEVTLTNDAPAVLPLGDTVVTWTATDPDGAESLAEQTVRVQDTTAPTVNFPMDIEEEAPAAGGGSVAFVVTATDLVDPAPAVVCSHASGSSFPVGTTTVSCTATDASGNETTASFDVTLTFVPPPPAIDFDGLFTKIEGMGLPRGIANALLAKVRAAATAHARGNLAATIGPLGALLNQIDALDGKMLTPAQAAALRECTNDLIAALQTL